MWLPGGSREIDRSVYLNVLPQEAANMSRNGVAAGIELLRFGEKWHARTDDPVVAKFYTSGKIQFKQLTEDEKKLVAYPEHRETPTQSKERKQRVAIVLRNNEFWWSRLYWYQRDYLLSLYWVPEEPKSPLEMLAAAAIGMELPDES